MLYYITIGGIFVRIYHNTKIHRYFVSINEKDVMELAKTPGEKLIEFIGLLEKEDKELVKTVQEEDLR